MNNHWRQQPKEYGDEPRKTVAAKAMGWLAVGIGLVLYWLAIAIVGNNWKSVAATLVTIVGTIVQLAGWATIREANRK